MCSGGTVVDGDAVYDRTTPGRPDLNPKRTQARACPGLETRLPEIPDIKRLTLHAGSSLEACL